MSFNPESIGALSLLEKIHPNVPRETNAQLLRYVDLVQFWNSRMNLTGAKNPRDFILHHVEDCSAAFQCLVNERVFWLDVGSGAGLPGIVWAILNPSLHIILIEVLQKRAAFLTRIKSELKLVNLEILNKRFESVTSNELELENRMSRPYVVSRGTSSPQEILELGAKTELSWQRWIVFSNEKTHQEYLDLGRRFGVRVGTLSYSRFGGENGRLTTIDPLNDHTIHDL